MIFIDTNVLLSFVTEPVTPQDETMHTQAGELLRGVAEGATRATANDVVFHEVCWILGAKHRYGMAVPMIIETLRNILDWPGWTFPSGDLPIYFRALDIFEQDHKLQFSDAIIAARSEALGAELATFDRRLANAYSGTVWPSSTRQ